MHQDDDNIEKSSMTDLRKKLDERKNQLKAFQENNKNDSGQENARPVAVVAPVTEEKKNDEDALDFEAEEGECNEPVIEEKLEAKVFILRIT